MSGLVLMNIAAQFVVYPGWNRALGNASYGNIVYLLAVMNILAISVGSGINYARIRRSANGKTHNRPYIQLLTAGSFVSILVLLLLRILSLLKIDSAEFVLFCLLTVVTMWRYYADIEYRLRVDYKGFFLYYLLIGIGYLGGVFLFRVTSLWPLALLPGEMAGLALVLIKGSIFKKDSDAGDRDFPSILQLSLLLVGANILSLLIFNGDRLILQWFAGSVAVTTYYIASLFGKTMTLVTTPLNGVLAGHLAKFKGNLTGQLMNRVLGGSLGMIVLATAVCVAASMIILPFLYPADYGAAKHFFVLACAAQIVYFVGDVLNASILLRFTAARNPVIVNAIHGILFVAACVPATWKYGIEGFCWGLLLVNTARCGMCLVLGYDAVGRSMENES